MLFNLHTHTHFSDGSSSPEEYVKEALLQGFHTLGFSDHSPVPFENSFAIREERLQEYITTILGLRELYPSSINILLALEIDFIPGITKPLETYREMNCFDYFIGSVHLVKNGNSDDLWFIDGPDINIYDEGLKRVFNNDIRSAVTAYYHQVNRMIETENPDIIGHLDKIRMYNRNRYFLENEDWYIKLIEETLDLVREKGCVVEVNTRGIYKKRSNALFPGIEILKMIRASKIPITLSSDAHKPHELSLYFKETRKLLKEIGFESISLRIAKGWKEVPLS